MVALTKNDIGSYNFFRLKKYKVSLQEGFQQIHSYLQEKVSALCVGG